ncbi:hypothetical protein J2S00_003103, partial [Caldalkalibacillus uzonensis]|nr:hypothetical protein [Caldalkalibacillus uzonensis]
SVFAKRLKNGRSWVEKGVSAMITGLVAYLDNLTLKTLFGRIEKWAETKEDQHSPKYYLEKITSVIGEATRNNIPYLRGKSHLPVYFALNGLRGF